MGPCGRNPTFMARNSPPGPAIPRGWVLESAGRPRRAERRRVGALRGPSGTGRLACLSSSLADSAGDEQSHRHRVQRGTGRVGVLPLVTALLPVIGKVVGLPSGDLAID